MTDKHTLLQELPLELPRCEYPRAAEGAAPGLLPLPEVLGPARLADARPHRSPSCRAVPLSALAPAQVLETAEVVAASFARREPQCRHLAPPRRPPPGLTGALHTDPFGSRPFGPWTRQSLMYWFIRAMVLTDPSSPRQAVRTNVPTLEQSIAIVGADGRVIGGAFNESMPPPGMHPEIRADDPFLAAVLSYLGPVLEMLLAQDAAALGALRERYPAFRRAHDAGRVGHHFMVARSDALTKEDAFELVAASVERYAELGFEYMLVEATNQWTGAACEMLGGVRVHYWPFLARRVVAESPVPLETEVSSPNGCLAAKDSGSMFYVIRSA